MFVGFQRKSSFAELVKSRRNPVCGLQPIPCLGIGGRYVERFPWNLNFGIQERFHECIRKARHALALEIARKRPVDANFQISVMAAALEFDLPLRKDAAPRGDHVALMCCCKIVQHTGAWMAK